MTDPNRRNGPGLGVTVQAWQEINRDLIRNASDVADAIRLMASARSAFTSAGEELRALIDARAAAPLNEAANANISARISELAQFTHQHPDG